MPYNNKVIKGTPIMTTTALRQDFSDFCAQRDAQNTIQLNVVKWTWMLCDALRDAAPDGYDYIFESGNVSITKLSCLILVVIVLFMLYRQEDW
jgi:hypothetical protein